MSERRRCVFLNRKRADRCTTTPAALTLPVVERRDYSPPWCLGGIGSCSDVGHVVFMPVWNLFFRRHMGAAEGFRTIPHEHERFGSHVGDLVVILRAEKNDLVFLDDPLLAFYPFDRGLALKHQKGLWRHVIVHVGVIARLEVKDPGTKSVCAKEPHEPLAFLSGSAHGVINICKFHEGSFDL